MSDITLEGIAKVIKTELEPVKEDIADIKETLAQHTKTLGTHTTALDMLLKAYQTKQDENVVSVDRFTRLELWAKQVGEKLGIKLNL